jgi:hypothetical protein
VARARKAEPEWDWPADYAKHRGVSRQAVYKAIAEGRIQLTQGKIDRALADREWGENSAPAGADVPDADPQAPAASYNQVRTLWQAYRAQLARLEYEERAGRLVDADKVRATAFEEGRRIQEKLRALPERVGPLLAMKSRADCTRILTLELRRLLEELAGPAEKAKAS